MRRKRQGEVVCTCRSYKFPHRQYGGKCKPQQWVERLFQPDRDDCSDCINRDGYNCQVVDQIEATFHCPALREYVRYEGIVLYGKAREQFERSQGK